MSDIKDGEILFLYEGKLTNPNGDIDDENRPRMDYETSTNLVSDVRLKRYIRDYLLENDNNIFINHGNVQTATERLNDALENKANEDTDLKKFVTDKFIDIRLFGAMIPISQKNENKKRSDGDSIRIVGPVQFSWGYSLNRVELLNSYSITGGFASSTGNKMNSIGKDYRLYYSLIGFYGVISSKRAKKANLGPDDIKKFDEAMINAIPSQASRSKINQMPVLYIRTESNGKYIGDLRDYIKLNIKKEPIRNINDYSISLKQLISVISENEISIAQCWIHKNLNIEDMEDLTNCKK